MASAQSVPSRPQRYSATAEYQKMIGELHAASTSPAYIATGEHAAVDTHLPVKVKETSQSLELTTISSVFTFDKVRFTLSVLNPATKASWVISWPAQGTGCHGASARAPAAKIERQVNEWTLKLGEARACPAVTLARLTDGLTRLTYTGAAGATARDSTVQLEGSLPLFGLGERFWQSKLAGAHLDVRPADKPGEPGHDWVYVAIPFVYNAGGLGLYADTVFEAQFRFHAASISPILRRHV